MLQPLFAIRCAAVFFWSVTSRTAKPEVATSQNPGCWTDGVTMGTVTCCAINTLMPESRLHAQVQHAAGSRKARMTSCPPPSVTLSPQACPCYRHSPCYANNSAGPQQLSRGIKCMYVCGTAPLGVHGVWHTTKTVYVIMCCILQPLRRSCILPGGSAESLLQSQFKRHGCRLLCTSTC